MQLNSVFNYNIVIMYKAMTKVNKSNQCIVHTIYVYRRFIDAREGETTRRTI